jgi:hypothetical protein
MITKHFGQLDGQPFVLELSESGAHPLPDRAQGGFWVIRMEGLI